MDGVTLPAAEWRERPGLDTLVAALGEGNARYVGGAVRDTLLGLPVSDIDLATSLPPETASARLRAGGFKVAPTGIAHGTVTAVLNGAPIEVTTLRRDVSTDGRHATVAFSEDWREDAARRDFTINALYADPRDGRVYDYFGGLDDLAARRVRFIGDPLTRIAEDHLRILRFFRFHARFGGEAIDQAALAACVARANDLMALSRERIAAEVLKLLVTPRAAAVLALMLERGVLAPVLPEIAGTAAAKLARLVAREGELGFEADAIRRLAALLPEDAQAAAAVAARLRLSNAQRKRLALAVEPFDADAPPRSLAYRIGVESYVDRALLSAAPDTLAPALAGIAGYVPARLPIGGGELVAMGVTAGPAVAQLLQDIERQWIEEDFPGRDRVIALAEAAAGHWLRAHSSA